MISEGLAFQLFHFLPRARSGQSAQMALPESTRDFAAAIVEIKRNRKVIPQIRVSQLCCLSRVSSAAGVGVNLKWLQVGYVNCLQWQHLESNHGVATLLEERYLIQEPMTGSDERATDLASWLESGRWRHSSTRPADYSWTLSCWLPWCKAFPIFATIVQFTNLKPIDLSKLHCQPLAVFSQAEQPIKATIHLVSQ